MEKLPTTESSYLELRKEIEKIINSNYEEIPYEGIELDKLTMVNEMLNFLFQNRIEFARLHVEAALKAAELRAENEIPEGFWEDVDDKNFIINSYLLENIK